MLSTVSQDEWHIHLGLAGSEGRWWHGSWKEEDIHRIFVCIYFIHRPWRFGLGLGLTDLFSPSLGRNIVG